jgi:tetratricopeptide (TPR) repeat protein
MLFLLAYGCSQASQAIKRGDELFTAKNYYGAALEFINALNLEADNKDAKMKLCQISKPAYEQKLDMAISYEKTSDFESALPQYQELSFFIDKLNSYNCLSFPSVNAKQKIIEMKSGASEKYYREAERFFNNDDYSSALSNYQDALKHNNPYKDCNDKIAESYYRIAAKAEKQKNYREAASNYLKGNNTVSGYKDSADKATNLYYALGDYFLKKGFCRNAYNDFDEANKINPGFGDVASKINDSEVCAVSKIAFMRFDNTTNRDIAGMSIGDFIFDEIKTKLPNKASKFIRPIERDELFAIMDEQRLGARGITDDYSTFKQLKGVHYLIFGKLTQVNIVRLNPKEENMKTTGSQSYSCIKQGRKGTYEGTCSRDVAVYFTKTSSKIDIALAGSIKVVSVATGEQLIFHTISSKRSDSIAYADITTDTSSISIPSSLEELAKARRELKDEDGLAKDMITEIADEMVKKILEKIDREKVVSDPVDIVMNR